MKTQGFFVTVLAFIFTLGELNPPQAQKLENNKATQENIEKSSDGKKKPSPRNLRQEGIRVVRQALADASYLDDARNSAYITAIISDLLWPYDEVNARSYLRIAFEKAVDFYGNSKNESQLKPSRGSFSANLDVRFEIVQIAIRRDTALGQEFQNKYIEEKRREHDKRPDNGEYGSKRAHEQVFGTTDVVSNDLLRIAAAFIESDLKKAVSIARQAFSTGIPRDTAGFLAQLASRDQAIANNLYSDALQRLDKSQIASPGQLLLLSAYPFGENKITIIDGVRNRQLLSIEQQTSLPAQEELIQQFIVSSFRVLTRVAEADPAQFFHPESQFGVAFYAIGLLEAKVAKHRPQLLTEWRKLKETLSSLQAYNTRRRIDDQIDFESKQFQVDATANAADKVKQLLEQAQSASSMTKREDLYVSAAQEALVSGDSSRAIDIISRIGDLTYREKSLSWFNFEAAMRSVSKNNSTEAESYARGVKPADQRAYLFLKLTQSFSGKTEDKKRELLEEALRYAYKSDEGEEKLRAIVSIGSFYLNLDKERGFDIASDVVSAANNAQNYNLQPPRLVRTLAKHGGSGYRSVVAYEGFSIGKMFARLAQIDVERSLSLAHSISTSLIRLEAIAAIGSVMLGAEGRGNSTPASKRNW